MNYAKLSLLLIVVALAAGCSTAIELKGEPTLIKGKVAKSGGKAVGGVLLTLQPLEDGHLTPLEVRTDGSFEGELVPGRYAYFVSKSSKSRGSEQVLKQVNAKFLEPDMSRVVTVAPGSDLTIALD